jgi:uncharacterized protein involved in exopolysaccharide biosynthesis
MPVPWLTVGKLVLANLDTLVNVVRPAFTRKQMHDVADRTALLDQQISELQAAATSNAEQMTQLAAQLKEVVAALAQSAAEFSAERAARRRRTRLALIVSGVALVCSLAALWGVYGG